MKTLKSIITFAFVALTATLFAQEPAPTDSAKTANEQSVEKAPQTDSTFSDTTRIDLNNAYITIISKNKKTRTSEKKKDKNDKYDLTWWNGVDVGVNGILGKNRDFNLGDENAFLEPRLAQSRYIAFNFAELKGRIVKDYVGFTTGLTVEIYNFKYGGSNDFAFGGDSLFAFPSGEKNITKNKLRAEYVGIPLLLEINTSDDPDRAFHISAGVIGKVRLGNMYKQKYDIDGNNNKTTIKGELGLNRWALDATARIGYGYWTVFAQVGILPMFDNDNTGDVYNFATGIAFTI